MLVVMGMMTCSMPSLNFKWNEVTPLIAAVRSGHIELVGSLIALGADIELRGRFSYTPLMFAALDGNPRMLSALLAVGADIHASSTDGGQSVFSLAEFGTENELMRMLLSYKAAINRDLLILG